MEQRLIVDEVTCLGKPALSLRTPAGTRATVLLYGGHVVSCRTACGDELLYLSPLSTTDNGCAVRGGIPVIFPQFDRRGPDLAVSRHGFARTHSFEWVSQDACGVTLAMRDDDVTRSSYPHSFELRLQLSLQDRGLTMAMTVDNSGERALSFTCALHTYLRVEALEQVAVEGLAGRRFLDKVRQGAMDVESHGQLRIAGEVDRIYADVETLLLIDGQRRVRVCQQGFADAVVWNPGRALASTMADLPDDGYRHMLCLEAARALSPVRLEPGANFQAQQQIALE